MPKTVEQGHISSIDALRERGICVIIPTYNNDGTILDIVQRTQRECRDVIVVNDGSTDSTASILSSIDDITVVSHPDNRGKGYALKSGFEKALSMGFSYAITLDSDGQHFPEDIPSLLEANIKYPGSIIVGERQNLDSVERSGGSKFANAFSNFWFMVQTWCPLRDTQTGYRLYPLKKLYGLRFLTSRYEAELELLVFASWHGVKLHSTPVNVYYPPREKRVSHFRPAKDFTRISILNTILCFLAVVYALPLKTLRFSLKLFRNIYSLAFFVFFSLFSITPLVYLYVKVFWMTASRKLFLHKLLNFCSRVIMIHHSVPGVKYTVHNAERLDFSRPSLIICNHQSVLDLMVLLALNPKIVVLTNDWVWRSPFFGCIIRNADFLPVSRGIDEIMPRLRELVCEGYSIAVYPEGTRSINLDIQRFHKGAFQIAHDLHLDIQPLVVYGAGRALPKKRMRLHKWPMHLFVEQRVPYASLHDYGQTIKDISSNFRKYFIHRYWSITNELEQEA